MSTQAAADNVVLPTEKNEVTVIFFSEVCNEVHFAGGGFFSFVAAATRAASFLSGKKMRSPLSRGREKNHQPDESRACSAILTPEYGKFRNTLFCTFVARLLLSLLPSLLLLCCRYSVSLVYSDDYSVANSWGVGVIKILIVNLQSGKPIYFFKKIILFNNL